MTDKTKQSARELQRLYGANFQLCRQLLTKLGFAGAGADLERRGYRLKDKSAVTLPVSPIPPIPPKDRS